MISIKTVGIILRENNFFDIYYTGVRSDLFKFLNKYSVNIIGIPINTDFEKIKNIIKLCDGIILSGGSNIIDNDFLLVEYLYENKIPTLGICLGMQSMAEYFNNKKEELVDNHYSKDYYVHEVNIMENSLLYKIIGKEKIKVNSRHRYKIPYTNMNVSALSQDNVIEAVELVNHKFFLGVQWHPESIKDENSYKLFKYFISVL